jgi:4'-phosphopantetheinyl transferase
MNDFGKPWLLMPGAPHFSVSHSSELAAYAISAQEVGVDIERKRYILEAMSIARRFFSPVEVAALENVSVDRLSVAFLTYWTHKEAYLKARGVGLSQDLSSFIVSMDEHSYVVSDRELPGHKPRAFYLQSLNILDDYLGAVATSYPVKEIQFCEWVHEPGNDYLFEEESGQNNSIRACE